MRKLTIFFTLIILNLSCKQKQEEFPLTSFEAEIEMAKWDSLYSKFQTKLEGLYENSENNPNITLNEIDKLLIEYTQDNNITSDLLYFKAELLYNIGEYHKSLEVLEADKFAIEVNVPKICNYIKTW